MPSSHFERRDPACNMRRFYRLTVTRDLFGTVLLVREWGRIGVNCRQRAEEKHTVVVAFRDASTLAAQKTRHGYVPVDDAGGRAVDSCQQAIRSVLDGKG